MNGPMRNSGMLEVERLLRAAADDDASQQAPSHVHAAVMRAWDGARMHAHQRRRRVSSSAALLATGSAAAALVAVAVLSRAPSEPSRSDPVAPSVEKLPAVAYVSPSKRGTPAEPRRPSPRRAETRGASAALRAEPGVMPGADPILGGGAISIVRVRVPRAALAPLGLALVEPNDGGSVDLELLVDEDGITRTIRRAVPVAFPQE